MNYTHTYLAHTKYMLVSNTIKVIQDQPFNYPTRRICMIKDDLHQCSDDDIHNTQHTIYLQQFFLRTKVFRKCKCMYIKHHTT